MDYQSDLGRWHYIDLLSVGCGNSNIQEGLVADGFAEVVNVRTMAAK